jgi:hypothetical protein
MMLPVKMFRSVLVLRRITAADVPAGQAKAQVYPRVADLNAIFADMFAGCFDLDLIQMRALVGHRSSKKSEFAVK